MRQNKFSFASQAFVSLPERRLRPDCEHDSPVYLPTLEALENIIDRFERLRLDDRLHRCGLRQTVLRTGLL